MTSLTQIRPATVGPAALGAAWYAVLTALAEALAASLRFAMALQERAQQRVRLADLDAAALKDMGLTPGDVARQLQKPMLWR
jgi:uncharacterized protein YjiS (DUF1127 family)